MGKNRLLGANVKGSNEYKLALNKLMFMVGQNLRMKRAAKKLTQKELAILLGYQNGRSQLPAIERGTKNDLSIATLLEVSYALGMGVKISFEALEKPISLSGPTNNISPRRSAQVEEVKSTQHIEPEISKPEIVQIEKIETAPDVTDVRGETENETANDYPEI